MKMYKIDADKDRATPLLSLTFFFSRLMQNNFIFESFPTLVKHEYEGPRPELAGNVRNNAISVSFSESSVFVLKSQGPCVLFSRTGHASVVSLHRQSAR